MSEEKGGSMEKLMELLAKEQTLTGKYHGHEGQHRVALREVEYWEDVLAKIGEDTEEHIIRKWKRNLEKAKARAEYHTKMAEEARKELEKVRKRIKELLGRERK